MSVSFCWRVDNTIDVADAISQPEIRKSLETEHC